MRVCIVGNSPSVLEKETGEFIDSCDRVVRINDFQVEGYEKHVGSKLDIVCYGFSSINKIRKKDVESANEVWCCRPFDGKRRHVAKRRIGTDDGIVGPSPEAWAAMVEVVKDHPRAQPSSGLATIGMCFERFPGAEIYIVGFDHEKYKKHYFDPDFIDDDGEPGHDWDAEMFYILKCVVDGRLRIP